MSADFTPTLKPYNKLNNFWAWCQKVLPLVYDDSLSYYELLCKMLRYMNEMIRNQDNMYQDISDLQDAFKQLQDYINNYFNSLDVQDEINNKLDELVNNGTLQSILMTHFKMGNALYIGNSYLNGTGSSNGNSGIYELTKHLFYKSYAYSSGGAGFYLTAQSSKTFIDLINDAISELSNDEKNGITHIIVLSAIGDSRYVNTQDTYDYGTFATNITDFLKVAKISFVNAEVYIALCDMQLSDKIENYTNYASTMFCHHAFKYISSLRHFNYLGWIGWEGNRFPTYLSQDGYHPNDRGYISLSQNLISSLTGNYFPSLKIGNFTSELGNSGTIYGTPDWCIIHLIPNTGTETPLTGDTNFIDLSEIRVIPVMGFKNSQLRVGIGLRSNDKTITYANLAYKNGYLQIMPTVEITLDDSPLLQDVFIPCTGGTY